MSLFPRGGRWTPAQLHLLARIRNEQKWSVVLRRHRLARWIEAEAKPWALFDGTRRGLSTRAMNEAMPLWRRGIGAKAAKAFGCSRWTINRDLRELFFGGRRRFDGHARWPKGKPSPERPEPDDPRARRWPWRRRDDRGRLPPRTAPDFFRDRLLLLARLPDAPEESDRLLWARAIFATAFARAAVDTAPDSAKVRVRREQTRGLIATMRLDPKRRESVPWLAKALGVSRHAARRDLTALGLR